MPATRSRAQPGRAFSSARPPGGSNASFGIADFSRSSRRSLPTAARSPLAKRPVRQLSSSRRSSQSHSTIAPASQPWSIRSRPEPSAAVLALVVRDLVPAAVEVREHVFLQQPETEYRQEQFLEHLGPPRFAKPLSGPTLANGRRRDLWRCM